MKKNLILDTDAYKPTQHLQYPSGITRMYDYGESRIGSKYPLVSFFGMSMIVKDHFLQTITNEMIEEAAEQCYLTFGTDKYFNRKAWEKVRDLGYLPIKITAVPEGTKVPVSNVLFDIESTQDWFATTLSCLETVLMHVWYPTTIATRSMYIKENLIPLIQQSGSMGNLPFMVNDFGARGATGHEAAGRGGAGHLLHFDGSDNMIASRALKDYYGIKGKGKSIWATEHSVATSFGTEGRGEIDYLKHQLTECPQDMMFANVIDTKNAFNYLKNVVSHEEILPLIKARQAQTIFRPDSGEIELGMEKSLEIFTDIFGFKVNDKGYKVLNNNVSFIQGDGMNENTIIDLYKFILKNRWSTDNLATGSGGGLLQVDANRDTQRFAIKASQIDINEETRNLIKNPSTDTTKGSKPGKLKLHPVGKNSFMTLSSAKETPAMFNGYVDAKVTVLENGVFNEDYADGAKMLTRANS
jgi:nicotinamide phosphoribosyltransferase